MAKTALALIALLIVPATMGRAQQPGQQPCALAPSMAVDTFESLSLESQTAKLEKLLPVLEAHPNSHGFIVAYAGRGSTLANAQKRADQAKRQLLAKHEWIRSKGLNSLLNTIVCGYREIATIELWVTPVGAAPPVCTPTAGIPAPGTKPRPPRRR